MPFGEIAAAAKIVSEVVSAAKVTEGVYKALDEGEVVKAIDKVAQAMVEGKLRGVLEDVKPKVKLPDASGAPKYTMKLPDAMSLKPPEVQEISKPAASGKNLKEEVADSSLDSLYKDTGISGPPESFKGSSSIPKADVSASNLPDWMKDAARGNDRPSPRDSERAALEIYGGEEQKSYKDGKEVPYGTPGSTRPDIVRDIDSKLEAIEIKNYDLSDPERVDALVKELQRQIGQRVVDLPEGTLQRVVLDIRGQNLPPELISSVKEKIQAALSDIYPNIPIDTINDDK